MKNLYILFALFISGSVFGQIEQNVNKTSGTQSNPINEIDSIRFNSNNTVMEIVLLNGNVVSHAILDINNVSFSGEANLYPPGTVHCGTPTAVVEVITLTGRTWMDRNLGASKVADSINDVAAYGSYYQWGRFSDGHQCTNSGITSVLSSTDQPGHGDFITVALIGGSPYNWRNPKNDSLWQGINGINNPCPNGFRIPTTQEFQAEVALWSNASADGGFESVLKLPVAGRAPYESGNPQEYPYISGIGSHGYFWTSNTNVTGGGNIRLNNATQAYAWGFAGRATGMSVRCIKDE